MKHIPCLPCKCKLKSFKREILTPQQIFDMSLEFLDVNKSDILATNRGVMKTYLSRHMINAALKYNTHLSITQIGRQFMNGRHHSTISRSLYQVAALYGTSDSFRTQYDELNKHLFS